MDPVVPTRIEPVALDELRKRLEFIAVRMLADREAAADAVQETMLRLLTSDREGRLPEANRVGAFAYGILRHVVVDQQRAAGRETVGDVPERASKAPDALEQLITDEEAGRVLGALRRLSAGDRQLLERCFIDGERIGAIARTLGEPEGRVRVRKLRALRRLRDLLEGNETSPTSIQE